MPRVASNGVELEYDRFGDAANPALLLVMGLGAQMIAWDERFCRALAERGFHVIRFDNRDSGLSTHLDHLGAPDLGAVLTRRSPPPYTLEDMAADAFGLLDALELRAAHLVGASMGGYTAQLMAISHPERVLTLTSIMSGLGGEDDVRAAPDVAAAVLAPPPSGRDEMIERAVALSRLLGSPAYFDEERVRVFHARVLDRSHTFAGASRQLAAVLAAPSRRARLGALRVPTLVIHGEADRLVPVENGRRTAAAVPGARLLIVPGMGHDLPPPLWPLLVDAIAQHAGASRAPAG